MNDTSLVVMVPQPAGLPAFSLNVKAETLKEDALAASALIGKVSNADDNVLAVRAMQQLNDLTKAVEKLRKTLKEPVLEAGRALDRLCNGFNVELEQEYGRLSHLCAEFQLAERRRVQQEEELQRRKLAEIEAERLKELAKAKTPEAKQLVEEKAQAATYAESKPIEATRASGQRVATDWEIDVVNEHELARLHPDCVKITALLGVIKSHLNEGREVKGIRAKKVLNADVRSGGRRAIEV